jgi:hypothetical protein
MKLCTLVLSLTLLTGCANMDFFKKPEIAIIAEKKIRLDPRVYEPCHGSLVALEGTTFEHILINAAENSKRYALCKSKQDVSIELLKSFTNKESNEAN